MIFFFFNFCPLSIPEKRTSGIWSVKNTLDLRRDILKLHDLGMKMYELADKFHLSHSGVSASFKTKDKCVKELEIVCTLHVRFLF